MIDFKRWTTISKGLNRFLIDLKNITMQNKNNTPPFYEEGVFSAKRNIKFFIELFIKGTYAW